MQMCDKCGALMTPKKENGKVLLVCPAGCARADMKDSEGMKLSEKIEHTPLDSIPVLDNKEATLPVMDRECSKCGNGKVFWWTRQTRSSDEPETRFYKCTKCSHTWREYS